MEVPNDKESEEAFDETFEQVKETLDAVGNCSTPANITGDSHLTTERVNLKRNILSLVTTLISKDV